MHLAPPAGRCTESFNRDVVESGAGWASQPAPLFYDQRTEVANIFPSRRHSRMPRITFHGAARTVTGSKYLLEAGDARVLIDCGLFQGLKPLRDRNWAPTPFDVNALDAVVLTHAHLDHVGYLPRIVKQGYKRPVYCTPATHELAEIILLDSAKCQEYDAQYANKQGYSKHKPALPLYDDRDVERTMQLFRDKPRDEWFCPAEPFWMRYHDAGHLLGSTMIEVEVRDSPTPLRILFSGDVGRYDGPAVSRSRSRRRRATTWCARAPTAIASIPRTACSTHWSKSSTARSSAAA